MICPVSDVMYVYTLYMYHMASGMSHDQSHELCVIGNVYTGAPVVWAQSVSSINDSVLGSVYVLQ